MAEQSDAGDESLITDAVRAWVDVASTPIEAVLSAELIRRVRETLGQQPAQDGAAPQSVLCALESNAGLPEIAGLPDGSLITGDEWQWLRLFKAGESLTVEERLTDARERMGGRVGHTLLLSYEWRFSGEDGAPVAYVRRSIARYAGAGAQQRDRAPFSLPSAVAGASSTPDAVVRVNGREASGAEGLSDRAVDGAAADGDAHQASAACVARRAQVGDPLESRLLTPSLAQVIRYCATAWTFQPIFFDTAVAQSRGLPGTIVPGPLKLALLSEWLLEWAGDGAFLERIRVAYRRPDQPGRQLRFGGSVISREPGGTGDLLECEVWLEQEAGERSTIGVAAVRLPT